MEGCGLSTVMTTGPNLLLSFHRHQREGKRHCPKNLKYTQAEGAMERGEV